MRIVFMGTPDLAASVLAAVAEKHDIVGVYTRPDAVRGRGKKLVASPVKECASRLGLKVFTPHSLKDQSVTGELYGLHPDAICVVAYGCILPPEVLSLPALGCLNVHTSLLPRWRGAAPMQRAILQQDETTGVCIMKMDEGLDTGPYCKRIETPLSGKYLDELQEELACAGASALLDALDECERETVVWTDQGQSGALYASKIGKGELDVTCTDSASVACAKVRASDNAHPAHCIVAGKSVTLIRISEAQDEGALAACEGLVPGEGVFRSRRLMLVAEGGVIEVRELKPEGKKAMEAQAFASGIQGIKNTTIQWGMV